MMVSLCQVVCFVDVGFKHYHCHAIKSGFLMFCLLKLVFITFAYQEEGSLQGTKEKEAGS